MYANLNGVNDISESTDQSINTVPTNVGLCFDRDESFHLSGPVEQARQIFAKLFPTKSFLPSEEDLAAAAAESQAVSDSSEKGVGEGGESMKEGEGETEVAAPYSVPYSTGELSEADQETRYLENTLRALNAGESEVDREEEEGVAAISE
jgi:hypothetical protein